MKENIENISNWLKNYLDNTGLKGYAIGLSGGIDSAVSLGLAIKAVGKENVRCFALPCTLKNKEQERTNDIDDAQLVADTYNIKLETIYLDESVKSMYNNISPYSNENKLVLPNIKARLRMVTLRALAEELGYLVLGTTNKTEEYLGYYTKAGDGGAGVDIEPIADFYKFEIRELASELGVPDVIINKSPSAGLWDNQTDEDEIGFKYDDIDKYLVMREHFLNNSMFSDSTWTDLSDIMKKFYGSKFDVNLINRIEKMIVNGNHKRNNPPYFNRNGSNILDILDNCENV